ncbi:MAG: aspartate carbamoyltransferase catalytic subunit [Christensenellaceae bacterium]|nr:aspartate carbamoyltransferase catalytic subunit [Christensenellaceae bacterium]
MKGLFNLRELSTEKINEIVPTALNFKKGIKSVLYPGTKMATLFFENSTRTHYSFIAAMLNLGIKPVQVNLELSSIKKGESLYDTVKMFECAGFDGVVIRHTKDGYYNELSGINIPIFNGGDGVSDHPTQTLLDLVTIYEEFGSFEGLKICIIGDISHSRVAHGDAEIMKRLGMKVYICGPNEFLDNTAESMTPDEACEIADIIMLLRVQFERHESNMGMSLTEYHQKFGLTKSRMLRMNDSSIIMHPAPINRGVEIANEVVECKKSRIFAQMTNGVYTRMAVIHMVLDGKL